MYINVTGHCVELAELDVFTSFHVVVDGALTRDRCDGVLRDRGVGEMTLDGNHVLVVTEAVRRLAAGQVEANWETNFSAMLVYADKKGWLSSDGSVVRVHIDGKDRS